VKSAPVNEPKVFGTSGKSVRMIAPVKSGTIIMPPGMRSMVRLIASCAMASLLGPKVCTAACGRDAAGH